MHQDTSSENLDDIKKDAKKSYDIFRKIIDVKAFSNYQTHKVHPHRENSMILTSLKAILSKIAIQINIYSTDLVKFSMCGNLYTLFQYSY